jgi:XTP/dITP diphosphohydrolase
MKEEFKLKRGDKLVLATHNEGKLAEFKELFAPFGLELISAGQLGSPEPVEDGVSFKDNAAIKAHASAKGANMIALADDSGLCVDALDGAPGIYTADWAEKPDGTRDFDIGMKRVEDELQKLDAILPKQRKASFNATLCLALPSGEEMFFEGKIGGEMIWPPRGNIGFGFDPTFMPQGYDISFGEMSSSIKHSYKKGEKGLSHRARAFAKLVEVICE